MKLRLLKVWLLLALAFSLCAPMQSAQAAVSQKETVAATDFLNPDGTLNLDTGVNEALDLTGWDIQLDAKRGPILSPQNITPLNKWGSVSNGINSYVNAIVIDNGIVYVGGSFTAICGNAGCNTGNIAIYNLAVWDGTSWSGLGGSYGTDGAVYALAVSNGKVYVGGHFSKICQDNLCNTGIALKQFAVWNGVNWSTPGYGFATLDSIYALAVNGNNIYVGGDFSYVCGNAACSTTIPARYIAKWDGYNWSTLGYGVDWTVYALGVSGSDVYLGGYFTNLCGNASCASGNQPAHYIAKWSGATSSWDTLGYGLNGGVRAITISGSNVYVGGLFTQVCGNSACNTNPQSANHIAFWNGSIWSTFGYGLNEAVYSLAVSSSNVYVSGTFTAACATAICSSTGMTLNRIAKWNGSTWSALGYGLSATTTTIAVTGAKIYSGGWAAEACGNAACNSGNTTLNYFGLYTVGTQRALNGGFNNYPVSTPTIPTNWKAVNFGATDGKNTASKQEGAYSVKIANTTSKTKTLIQTLTLSGTAGNTFTFSFWVKSNAIPTTAGVCQGQVILYNDSTVVTNQALTCPTGSTSVFQPKAVTFNATGVYNKVVIKFTYSKATGAVWFDNVSLFK